MLGKLRFALWAAVAVLSVLFAVLVWPVLTAPQKPEASTSGQPLADAAN